MLELEDIKSTAAWDGIVGPKVVKITQKLDKYGTVSV